MRGGRGTAALALALVASTLAGVGCQRSGVPDRPGEPPAPARDRVAPADPGRPDTAVSPGQVGPVAVEVDEIDLILRSPVAGDAWLLERVGFWVHFWTVRSSGHFQRYLERMGIYRELVEAELEGRRLPPSLRYLPIVESGYHPGVVSRAGATGLWQLMGPTARDLGLSVTGIVDDRRDPVVSTVAALDYLEELYARFDSWFLALAAYNAGPNRLGRILERHDTGDEVHGDELFLRIRSDLPAETREFVPRFFAAAVLARDPEAHGFEPPPVGQALAFEEVTVPDATSLDVIARAAEVDEEEILALNRHFARGFTPMGERRTVRVPVGRGDRFAANYALIPPDERLSVVEHVIAPGETFSHIAGRYGVPVRELTDANGGLDPRRLQIGARILVPVAPRSAPAGAPGTAQVAQAAPGSAPERAAAGPDGPGEDGGSPAPPVPAAEDLDSDDGGAEPDPSPDASAEEERVTHVVASGESLWTIARTYGVRVRDLASWNGLGESAVLRPGQELEVGGRPRGHRVATGDTWLGIARRYGVAPDELARVNGRSVRDVIRIGEELRLP